MEIGTKQKVLIFAAMALIFATSVFVKGGFAASDGTDSLKDGIIIETGEEESESGDDEGEAGDGETDDDNPVSGAELYIVDVEGAVVFPGVVKIKEGSRVYEAIELAGGMLDTADSRNVNLAEVVEDGTVVYIPFEGESADDDGSVTQPENGGLVNINKADRTTLMTLPGIGEAYASSIIEYREKNGKFKSKEDIKNVSGIGDAKFAKLEELICV